MIEKTYLRRSPSSLYPANGGLYRFLQVFLSTVVIPSTRLARTSWHEVVEHDAGKEKTRARLTLGGGGRSGHWNAGNLWKNRRCCVVVIQEVADGFRPAFVPKGIDRVSPLTPSFTVLLRFTSFIYSLTVCNPKFFETSCSLKAARSALTPCQKVLVHISYSSSRVLSV